jgi:hypothetical protein
MAPHDLMRPREAVRTRMRQDRVGRIVYGAWANAIKGRVPA